MSGAEIVLRVGRRADVRAVLVLVESAYRGDSARRGWTHEADLLEGRRTSEDELVGLVAGPDDRMLVAEEAGMVVGCVHVGKRNERLGYLGMLSVEPGRQASGLGKRLIAAAEREVVGWFGAERMEMTVISRRAELIRYYERRGYALTGERRPFPVVLSPPLELLVMNRWLDRD